MEIDLNKLRDHAYKTACEHGFHDKEHSDKHWLMLVISEIGEAINADRKNKHADIKYFKEHDAENSTAFKYYFETCIKDTIEDELADIVIRLFDLAGLRNIDLKTVQRMYEANEHKDHQEFFDDGFLSVMYSIVKCITNDTPTESKVCVCMISIICVAYHYHIDIFQHIEWKMRYNELRPRLNGKEY